MFCVINTQKSDKKFQLQRNFYTNFHHRIRKGYFPVPLRARQVPRATAFRGSSATWKGMLILSVKRLAMPRSREPPPASQMPFFTMLE